jgi:hypothetical protein
MADKRYLRSTINLYANTSGNPITEGYALLSLFINGSTTPLYEVRKNAVQQPNGNIEIEEALFEVGELFSDYLDIDFNGTYTSQSLQCEAVLNFYDSTNTVTPYQNTFTFYGVDGFTYFEEGANVIETGTPPAITTRTLYVPENTAGYVPTFSATGFTYNSFSATATSKTVNGVVWKIVRVCEPRFDPYKITFVNKYGALQNIYFTLMRRDSVATRHENFKRNIVNNQGAYSTDAHQTKTFNFQGTDSFTLNTPFVNEQFNETLEELMLSKKIWVTENGQVLPVICTTKSLEKKTLNNDKLVQYQVGFKYAFDKINKVR